MNGMEDDLDREDDLSDLERQPDDYYEDEELFLQEPTDEDLDQIDWDYEPSPEERWQAYLNSENESVRIQQLADALIALGCSKPELINAILRVKTTYFYGSASRKELQERAERVARAQEYLPLSTGDKFSNDDWKQLQDLLVRYEQHLRLEAERMKRRPYLERRQALIALLELVQQRTHAPQHRLVLELLRLFVDDRLTWEKLRKDASRAGLTKKVPAKPKSRAKRPTGGRPALPDAKKVATRLHYDREVGRIPGRNYD